MTDTTRNITQAEQGAYIEQAGQVHIHPTPAPLPRHLTQPPFGAEIFLGRDGDLDVIRRELAAQQSLLLVNGEGGIGKTTLAAHYYWSAETEYRHLAWLFAETGILPALLMLAVPLRLRFQPESTEDQRLRLLLTALAELPAPCLLVIDNANDPVDLQRHAHQLRRLGNCRVLLTSRAAASPGMTCHRIEALPPRLANDLFKRHYPGHDPADADLLADLLIAVGHNTLVVELLAKYLHTANAVRFRIGLPQLLRNLQQHGLLLSLAGHPVATDYHADAGRPGLTPATPEAILAAMYQIGELTDPEQTLLSIFSVLPAEFIAYPLLEQLVADWQAYDPALQTLHGKGWLDRQQQQRDSLFKISPVVQEIVLSRNAGRLDADCRNLLHGLSEKLAYEPGTGHLPNVTDYAQAASFARYAASLSAALRRLPRQPQPLLMLDDRLGTYYRTTGNLAAALKVFEDLAGLAQILCASEPDNEQFKHNLAISYSNLGDTHTALGNLPLALQYHEKDLELSKALYADYPQNVSFKNGLAISYSKLGETHTALGNLPLALQFFTDATGLFEAFSAAYPQDVSFKNGLAISYSKLGETHTALGNLPLALQFFTDATGLFEALYADYPQNVWFKNGLAISYSKLGDTHTALGNLPLALQFFTERSRLGEELSAAYPQNVSFKNGLAISYSKLGDTHTALGNLPLALQFFTERSRLGEELSAAYPQNVSFKNGLAVSYSKLGIFYRDHCPDQAAQARYYLALCCQLFQALHAACPEHAEFRNNFAWAQQQLEQAKP